MAVSFFPASYLSITAKNYVCNAAAQVIIAKITGITNTKAVIVASLVADIAFSAFMAIGLYYLGFGALGAGINSEIFRTKVGVNLITLFMSALALKLYCGQTAGKRMDPQFNYIHLFSRHVILLVAAQLSIGTCSKTLLSSKL